MTDWNWRHLGTETSDSDVNDFFERRDAEIMRLRKAGVPVREIAEIMNIHPANVYKKLRRMSR